MVRIFFVTVVLWLISTARTAFAHDAPPVASTRLDFDATQAPKNCDDQPAFKSMLANWVAREALSTEADRRLVVRIHGASKRGKRVDVTLLDAGGVILGERQEHYDAKTECHKVLYDAALAAANLLGAFEKPPAPAPIESPVCPVPPAPEPAPAPAQPPQCLPKEIAQPSPRKTVPVAPLSRRAFVGAGVFLGTGITSKVAIGPSISLGFVPSRHSPRIQIEIDGAWSRQILPRSLQVQVVPLYGALCYSRYVFRVCSGLTATFFQMEHTAAAPRNDESRTTLAGHLRMGTEFEIAGPFSIRVDGFATLRFWQRSFGAELAALDAKNSFGAGALAMGVWSFE